ncbi:MAG: B12-binding domain-containing radical SAM protein [Clostridiales Family XIII bacterium]|jgi:radical SAM superfamily enzyme YgiQ (UPF0313 family)|nr:B12-binding domain-containing radical SAM protein [Clostridiales Family XIII bacterium]
MEIRKIRFLEPGSPAYRPAFKNRFVYEETIRNPSIGLMTLATIARGRVPDTRMYSESISLVDWKDVLDADVVFLGVFTFAAPRGYKLAQYIKAHSKAVVVMGGLHASMNYMEAVRYCDYVLLGEGDESIGEFLDALAAGREPDFPGVAYRGRDGETVCTGARRPPERFETVPDRGIVVGYRERAGYNTLWPQVHASRGCPHDCDYCAVVRHFGRRVRTRSPESVVEDIRQAIAFHEPARGRRLTQMLWITDDNFFADRAWAVSVLEAIIDSGISYHFTIQARYEVGFDDEMLELMKRAGFTEVAMGIEFIEDESFEMYHKKCTKDDVVRSIRNIQAHGLGVRGLFILGADSHTKGVGARLAAFVEAYGIKGVLIQAMYFVPGTPAYEAAKDRLLHRDWEKYCGNAVHRPARMTAAELQREVICASRKIYSPARLLRALLTRRGTDRVLFIGEYLWQASVRKRMRRELANLEAAELATQPAQIPPAQPAATPAQPAATPMAG